MGSQTILGLSCTLFLCAVVSAQVYVLGDSENSYQVPGVPGVFHRSSSAGSHTYNDGNDSFFIHKKAGERSEAASTHTIITPHFAAQNGPQRLLPARYDHTQGHSRPGHNTKENNLVPAGTDSINNEETHGQYSHSTYPHRDRRDPQFGYVSRPDGRSVTYGANNGVFAIGADGRTAAHIRRRRQKVQGDNFVANGDQAGIWGDGISVWKRPDGRTVSVDKNGTILVTGRLGTQVYKS